MTSRCGRSRRAWACRHALEQLASRLASRGRTEELSVPGKVTEIAAAELSRELFREDHVLKGRPLIIRQIARGEDIFCFQQFRGEMSAHEVPVCEYSKRRIPKWRWNRYCYRYNLTVGEYVQMLEDGRARQRDIYLSLLPIGPLESAARARGFLDQIGQRFGLQPLCSDMDGFVWIGPVGHIEPLHTDEGDNTLYQVCGTKRMVLFPATQMHNLYPFPLLGPVPPWVCQVELDRPDYERFPGLRQALQQSQEVVLEPGDLLYLPTQWGHETTILAGEPCISLSRQWKIAPWLRNFCTSRCALYYLKRHLPREWLIRTHGLLSSWRSSGARGH